MISTLSSNPRDQDFRKPPDLSIGLVAFEIESIIDPDCLSLLKDL